MSTKCSLPAGEAEAGSGDLYETSVYYDTPLGAERKRKPGGASKRVHRVTWTGKPEQRVL